MSKGFEDSLQLLGVRASAPTREELDLKKFQTDRLEIEKKLLELERLSAKNPVAQKVRSRIEAGQKQVEKKQVVEGTLTLKKVESLQEISEATTVAKEEFLRKIDETNTRRKEEFKQLESKQLYLADLEAAQKAEAQLTGLAMATTELNALTQMIQKARVAEARGDFVQGRKELTRVKDVLKEGLSKQENAVEKAKRSFEGIFRSKGDNERVLRESLTLHPTERDVLLQRLNQVVQATLGKPYTSPLYNEILENLDVVIDDVQKALKQADDLAKKANQSHVTCQRALEETQKTTTIQERAALERDARTMVAWIEQREFQRVVDGESEFLAEAKRLCDNVKNAKDEWERIQSELKEWIVTCGDWAKLNSPALRDFEPSPSELKSQLETLSQAKVGSEMPFPTAVKRFQDLAHNGSVIRARLETYDEFLKRRAEIGRSVVAEINLAKQAMRNLLERSDNIIRREVGNPLDSGGRFGERLKELEQRWQTSFDSALAASDLPDAEIIKLAKELAKDINATTDPQDYHKLYGDELLATAREHFNLQAPDVRDKLNELRKFASPRLGDLERSLQTVIDRVAEAKDAATVRKLGAQLEEVDTQIHSEIWLMQKDTLELRIEAMGVHQRIGRKLDEFDHTLQRYEKSFLTRNPQYQEYSKTLQQEWLGLSHVQEEYDRDVLQQAVAGLRLLEKRVDDASGGLNRGATSKDEPVLENVVEQISRAKTLLKDNETLATFLSAEKGQLDQRIKDIDGSKTSRPFDESLKELADWNTSYLELAKKAAIASRDYVAFEKQVEEARALLKTNHSALEPFQNYLKQLEERLEKLLKDGKSASGVASAVEDVKKLVEEVNKVVSNPDSLREESELAVARDQKKNDEAHEWAGLVKRFDERTLPELKEAKVRGELYDEVVKLGDLAKETFKRTQDFEMSRTQLDLASRRAKDALAFPQGQNAYARAEIPKAARQWGESVRLLRTELEKLLDEIRKADPESKNKEATQKAAAELDKVRDLYLEGAFTKIADRLAMEGLSDREIRAAREEGLRTVRQYQSLLLKDLRTQQLFDNPFVKPFRVLNSLNHALLNLEYNLLLIQ